MSMSVFLPYVMIVSYDTCESPTAKGIGLPKTRIQTLSPFSKPPKSIRIYIHQYINTYTYVNLYVYKGITIESLVSSSKLKGNVTQSI